MYQLILDLQDSLERLRFWERELSNLLEEMDYDYSYTYNKYLEIKKRVVIESKIFEALMNKAKIKCDYSHE